MSDPDRRANSQGSEPPLAFDDRRPARRGGPAPVTLIVSLLLLIVVGGGVFMLYRGGVRGTNEPPQPVGAPLRDVRSPPPPQAQAVDPAAGLSIYKDDPNAAATAPTFVAPPEQPAARTPPSPAPVAATPPPPPPPVDAEAGAAASNAKPPATVVVKTAKVKAAPAAAPADAAKSGPAVVQIGAFSTEALADKGWSAAASVAPGAMAGKGKRVSPLTKDGVTLYRTAITGFASHDEAQSLCDRLKAAGKTCFVR